MENTFKTCPQCGTENKSESKFCKKCGTDISQAALEVNVTSEMVDGQNISANEQPATAVPEVEPVTVAPTITPVSQLAADPDYIKDIKKSSIAEYMGQSSEKLYNKYIKYCDNRSVWNWPVFFFSLIGVPFVWFFYRKMYKVGLVVLAIWFALTFSTSLMGMLALKSVSDPIASFADTSFNIIENEMRVAQGVNKQNSNTKTVDRELNKTIEAVLTDAEVIVYLVLSFLLSVAQIVFIFVLPTKANRYYYAKMENDLRRLQNANATDAEIRAAGGVNVTAAVVSGFAIYSALRIVTAIPVSIVGSELISQLISSFTRFLKNLGVNIRWTL